MGVDRQRGVLHGVASGRNITFNVTRSKVARIARTFLRAEVTPRGRDPIAVSNLNSPTVDTDGIGLYTPRWGGVSRRRVVPGEGGREVLVGVGRGARQLSRLAKGTRVTVDYGLTDEAVRVAVGGNAPLLRNGEINAPGDPARRSS